MKLTPTPNFPSGKFEGPPLFSRIEGAFKACVYGYRSQRLTLFFVADFYCDSFKLVIEIDGLIHERQKERDLEREKMIFRKYLLA